MSEHLTAAAQAMGMPEAVVRRSAEAKAAKTGVSVDDILREWAGGEPVSGAAAPETEEPVEPSTSELTATATEGPPPSAEVSAPDSEPQHESARILLAEEPAAAPILEGRRDRPFAVTFGALGIFLVTILISFISPSSAEVTNSVYSSAVPMSERGTAGRSVYLSQGCAACHTQMVRPVVADTGLGGVTMADSNQVLGSRRYGPDVAHVGSRYTAAADLRKILGGETGHLPYGSLSETNLQNLITYLLESR